MISGAATPSQRPAVTVKIPSHSILPIHFDWSKIQDSPNSPNQESQTQTNICDSLFDRCNEVNNIAWVVFQISVLDDHDRTSTCCEPGPKSRRLTLIRFVPEELHPLVPTAILVTYFWGTIEVKQTIIVQARNCLLCRGQIR
jgi:hypothetical protein